MGDGFLNGFLFSVLGELQVERLGQVERGVAQRPSPPGSPEVKHVAMRGTMRIETLKDVFLHVC